MSPIFHTIILLTVDDGISGTYYFLDGALQVGDGRSMTYFVTEGAVVVAV